MVQEVMILRLPYSIEAAKVEEIILEELLIPKEDIEVVKVKEKVKLSSSKNYAKYHEHLMYINKVKARLDAKVYGLRLNFF